MSAPLLIRPGMRYECHGDGTCCTIIHQLGPLTRAEALRVRIAANLLFPDRKQPATSWHDGIKGTVIETEHDRCMFLDARVRCSIQARLGPQEKPAACRHFPLGTIATAAGVRVTLSHRCPCVSIGPNPSLDAKRARAILASPESGRIIPANRLEGRVRWRGKRAMDIDVYAAWEKPLLEKLDDARGETVESILRISSSDRLPKLKTASWSDVARHLVHYVQGKDTDAGFLAVVRWVEHALQGTATHPPRPWAWSFARTGDRAPHPTPVRGIYGSWLADELWAMAWAQDRSAYRALVDMASRYVVARRVAARLEDTGVRQDLAAAEAIMIVDALGACEPWAWAVQQMQEPDVGSFE